MLIIRSDYTKIRKEFVSSDKDLDRIKQLFSHQLDPQKRQFCKDTVEGMSGYEHEKGLERKTVRMTER